MRDSTVATCTTSPENKLICLVHHNFIALARGPQPNHKFHWRDKKGAHARNHLTRTRNILNNKVMSDPLNAPDGEAVFRITREDVVMGRGGSSQNHSGNVTYRKLVHHNKVRLVSYAFNNRHCHCVLITAGYLCAVNYIISWTCDALIVFFTPQ